MTGRWWLWQDDQIVPVNEAISAGAQNLTMPFGIGGTTVGAVRYRVGDAILTIEGDVNDGIGATLRRLP